MRGRKPDSAARQAAKGNPSTKGSRPRASKKDKRTAEQRAAVLASVQQDHPKFLADHRLKAALDIWRELEPDLRRLHLLDRLDRHTFAMYCVHMADWITATRDIQNRGHWKNVKNVNGEPMPRLNPMVKVREIAERHILEISSRFGLDPANRYKLLRDQAAAPKAQDLFSSVPGQPAAGASPPASGPEPDELPSPIGLMDDLASRPPGTRPN